LFAVQCLTPATAGEVIIIIIVIIIIVVVVYLEHEIKRVSGIAV